MFDESCDTILEPSIEFDLVQEEEETHRPSSKPKNGNYGDIRNTLFGGEDSDYEC
jgi:hypothetical protein